LEIRGGDKCVPVGVHTDPEPNPLARQPRRNPRRQAAVDAENRRRAWIEELI